MKHLKPKNFDVLVGKSHANIFQNKITGISNFDL